MTKPSHPPLLIAADSPEALTELCGISLLERMRRVALHLGFREAMVLSNSVEAMAEHLAQQSWHRSDLSLTFRERRAAETTVGDILNCLAAMKVPSDGRILIVFAGYYCDGRLFHSLAQTQTSSALIDSDPPSIIAPLLENSDAHSVGRLLCATLLSSEWLSGKNRVADLAQEIALDMTMGQIASVDAAQQQAYVESMRRNVRPVFFPAPSPERRLLAERFLRDATQSGVLDFPALVHAPIEKWIVSHLSRTSITPNQITLGTGIVGLCVTLLYAFGHLWVGALLALLVGILDGVDGKLARLRVQTTRIGKGEHLLDYFVEMSWWAALAYHFHITGQVRYAYVIWLIFFTCDSLERLAKRSVKVRVGRSIDDVSRLDQLVRYVAGRRNIYTWLFTFCLLTGAPATGFILLCLWGMATAAIHIFRALQIHYTFQNKIA
jgi:1L-myo-inositol 1-phosphate cytidylyltransferase / CDP-L-myo-inositol myo-inositolphosphotransferase